MLSVYGSYIYTIQEIMDLERMSRDQARRVTQVDQAKDQIEERAMNHFTDEGRVWMDAIIEKRMPPNRGQVGHLPVGGDLHFHSMGRVGGRDGATLSANLHHLGVLGQRQYVENLPAIFDIIGGIVMTEYRYFPVEVMCRCGFQGVNHAYYLHHHDGRVFGPVGYNCLFNKFHFGFVWAKVVRLSIKRIEEHDMTYGQIFNSRNINPVFDVVRGVNGEFSEWVLIIELLQDRGIIKQDLVF